MVTQISTTLPLEMWNLAKEKHIKWSEALHKGILVLIREAQRKEELGMHIDTETLIAKKDKVIQNLTETIENLDEQLNQLKKENVKNIQ
jgi:hypothetical protein